MENIILNKHFKMLEILNLINFNIGYDNLEKLYINDDIYILLDSIELILSDNLYLFSLNIDNLKKLYSLFNYYRYNYSNRDKFLINRCNKLISLLNLKIYELDNILMNIENRKINYYEIVNVCYNRNIFETSNNYSIVSFNIIKKIWESEYYLEKYLLNKELLDINVDYLLNSAFIEFGIIHLKSFYKFSEEDKIKLNSLLLRRMKNRKNIYKLDVHNIYLNKKEIKLLIVELLKIINGNEKNMKKDK